MSAHLSEAERGMGQMAFLNGVPVLRMYSEVDVEAILAARVAAAVAAEREAWVGKIEALAVEVDEDCTHTPDAHPEGCCEVCDNAFAAVEAIRALITEARS